MHRRHCPPPGRVASRSPTVGARHLRWLPARRFMRFSSIFLLAAARAWPTFALPTPSVTQTSNRTEQESYGEDHQEAGSQEGRAESGEESRSEEGRGAEEGRSGPQGSAGQVRPDQAPG